MVTKALDITPLIDYALLICLMVKIVEDKGTADRVLNSEWFSGLQRRYGVKADESPLS